MAFIAREIPDITQTLGKSSLRKLHGLGIALPFQLWSWSDTIDAPAAVMEQWRDFSFTEALADLTDLPIFIENDATSACGAELTFGQGQKYPHFAYFFIGYFVGGALVLNGSVYAGQTGNAGAFGSIPVVDEHSPGALVQLIDTASVYLLENTPQCRKALKGHYLEPDSAFWTTGATVVDHWIQRAATSPAMTITSVSSITDVGAIIIDGGFPDEIRARIVAATRQSLEQFNTRGIILPIIEAGVQSPSVVNS